MHLEITPEVLASQLKMGKTEASLNQIEKNIKFTRDFNSFSKHLLSLNDKLKHMNAYVGLSNKESYFKIKCEDIDSEEIKKEFLDEINHWSDRYNVELKQVENKNVYYIIGKK
jgi:tetrahydromethanopterin S-methyltransferase subunit G